MSDFQLDARLQRDCKMVTDLPLCRLLMMDDCNYPWFILVPRRPNVRELFELEAADLTQFWLESKRLSEALMSTLHGDKLNIAMLGNVVAQLHAHHIVRYHDDIAWPQPVWGAYPAKPYSEAQAQALMDNISAHLAAG